MNGGITRRTALRAGAAAAGLLSMGVAAGENHESDGENVEGYLNLAADVPDEAYAVWEAKPDVREAYNTVDASAYDGRNGDLAELIMSAATDGAIVDLGNGTYEMHSSVTTSLMSPDIVGVVGDGARIYYTGTDVNYLFHIDRVSTGVFEGVTFDITETTSSGHDSDVGILEGRFSEEFWAEDVEVIGARHRWQDLDGDGSLESVGGRFTWKVDMTEEDAIGFIHRCRFPDGGTDRASEGGPTPGHAIGPNSDRAHVGLNVWKECYAANFDAIGFYVFGGEGRNVLWDCHARDNAAANIRLGDNDLVIGGLSEIHELPDGRGGQPLVVANGENVRVIGLTIHGTGYGNDAVQVRSGARELELDRVVVHTNNDRRAVRLSSSGRGPNVDVTINDCYWYDEYGRDDGTASVLLRGANVTANNWHVFSEARTEIEVEGSSSLVHNGENVGPGRYTSGNLGMESPLPLPEFNFDYGLGDERVEDQSSEGSQESTDEPQTEEAEDDGSEDDSSETDDDSNGSDGDANVLANAVHPTIGSDAGAPKARLFGNLKCPFTSQVFTDGIVDAIVSEYVESGEMVLEYRELAYRPGRPGDHYINENGELKAQLAQGVWEEDPHSFWDFLEHAYVSLDGWTPLSDLGDIARDADVSNVDTIVDGVENDRYVDSLEETAAVAKSVDVPFTPTLVIGDDAMNPRHSQQATLDWIATRL